MKNKRIVSENKKKKKNKKIIIWLQNCVPFLNYKLIPPPLTKRMYNKRVNNAKEKTFATTNLLDKLNKKKCKKQYYIDMVFVK